MPSPPYGVSAGGTNHRPKRKVAPMHDTSAHDDTTTPDGETDDTHGLLNHKPAAQSSIDPGLLIVRSDAVFQALLWLPLLAWVVTVGTGAGLFAGLPSNKRAVKHAMQGFDRAVFRTAAGPALPFLALAARALAGLRLGAAAAPGSRGAQPLTRASLAPHVLAAYALVTLARWLLYGGHLAAQFVAATSHLASPDGVNAPLDPSMPQDIAYMSDHVLLGAAIVACLHVELLCGVSDLTKQATARCGWMRLATTAWITSVTATLAILVALDMHATARYFHAPLETVVALVVGAALFHVPLLVWVRRRRVDAMQFAHDAVRVELVPRQAHATQ